MNKLEDVTEYGTSENLTKTVNNLSKFFVHLVQSQTKSVECPRVPGGV